ncbi:uncharacterized protein PgNI_03112, partial [Pyricularia grisea]|uniref:Uncharacterized protein n=1 Tax=Pyricularia grisea TaxID=148305 RepID=A0A6P8BAD9_PYRGI
KTKNIYNVRSSKLKRLAIVLFEVCGVYSIADGAACYTLKIVSAKFSAKMASLHASIEQEAQPCTAFPPPGVPAASEPDDIPEQSTLVDFLSKDSQALNWRVDFIDSESANHQPYA